MICYLVIIISIIEFINKRYFNALIFFFFLLLDGFQVIPMYILTLGFYSGYSGDGAFLIFIILFVIRGKYWLKNGIRNTLFSKTIFLFLFILFVNTLYGIASGYELIDVFKGARLYLFLFGFFMFTEIPISIIVRVFKILIIITFFQSILFLMQVLTGITLLQGPKELFMDDLEYTRFYNLPKLLDFSMAVCLFWYPFKFSKVSKYIFVGVFILTIIAPLHRSYIIAWFIVLVLYSIFYNRSSKKMLYSFGVISIVLILSTISIIKNRFADIISQMEVLGNLSFDKTIESDGTFSYRIAHLMERLRYINSLDFGWLFGIGLLDEKSQAVSSLPLKIGLPDPITGIIVKVYTPDLVWSMLILTMGYVGAFFYLNIFINILRKYSRNKRSIEISKIIFVLVLLTIFLSFTSNTLLNPIFFIPVFILIIIIEKRNEHFSKNKL
jgi:hypothetical protein